MKKLYLFTALLFFTTTMYSETILLKNGDKITGTIIEKTERKTTVRNENKIYEISNTDIQYIFDEKSPNQQNKKYNINFSLDNDSTYEDLKKSSKGFLISGLILTGISINTPFSLFFCSTFIGGVLGYVFSPNSPFGFFTGFSLGGYFGGMLALYSLLVTIPFFLIVALPLVITGIVLTSKTIKYKNEWSEENDFTIAPSIGVSPNKEIQMAIAFNF